MAICEFCNQEMLTAESCAAHLIVYQTGERLSAIRFGSEEDGGYREPTERCHDCNVAVGAFHHPNCDVEQCPRCGGQLISCRCEVEACVEDVSALPVAPSMGVKELETVGGFPYRVFEKDAAQKPAPAPFPPSPVGTKMASQVVFPGIGKCDIWFTHDIATHDAQFSLADGNTAEFARCYSPGLSKHSFATGFYNERNEYITQVAVQLRARPGSEEAKVVLDVIAIITGRKNRGDEHED